MNTSVQYHKKVFLLGDSDSEKSLQGVTAEGVTLSLVGSATSFWDICDLTFNKVPIKI